MRRAPQQTRGNLDAVGSVMSWIEPLAVELARVHVAKDVEDFPKSVKPSRFGRHGAGGDFTRCEGVIRHYMISGRVAGRAGHER